MIIDYLPSLINLLKENLITPFLYLSIILGIFFLLTVLISILFDTKLKAALFHHNNSRVEIFYASMIWLSLFLNTDLLGISITDKSLTYPFFAVISILFVLLIVFTSRFSSDSASAFHTIIFSFFVTTIIVLSSLFFLIKDPENILILLSLGIVTIIFEKMISNKKYADMALKTKIKVIEFLLAGGRR